MKKCLNKSDKLKLKSDFESVRQSGKKYLTNGLVVFISAAPDEKLRCGIICSRKYSHLAVRRNRARRILWESFRLLKPEIAPCHLVLITRYKMMDYKQSQAMEELKSALRRGGVFL